MAANATDSPPGFIEEIDRVELDLREIVGKGSFGVVYMAVWRNIHVAVKMIEAESERIAFMTELRQLSRVSHDNIICLYGACRNPVSLVMELAECGSLYNLLHGTGPQPHYTSGHAMSWCKQCAVGVAYLHNMKPKALIHRDLKPPNLLLTNLGTVLKICDFGTACDQHTHMTNNKGSAAWMAPEVFEGCQYSEKCDVFSWGIILWEVLTRRKPFDELGGPAFRIMWAVHTGSRPSLITGCPKPIEQLMTSCWSANPHERPSMDEVVEATKDLMLFFEGGDVPLNFPSQDSGSGSDTSSCYESSIPDSFRESHNSTISDTIRKTLPRPSLHSNVAAVSSSRSNNPSPIPLRPGVGNIILEEGRVRSRSHTPDPQNSADSTRKVFKKGHRRASSYGNKLDVPRDLLRPTVLSEAGKFGSTRKSSSDLIAEMGKQPIEPITPIGSRTGSPAFGVPMNSRMPLKSVNSPMTPNVPFHKYFAQDSQSPKPSTSGIFADPQNLSTSFGEATDSQCDSLPRAYITLELHLQPLPPSTSSKKSMEIYQQHCMLAEEYLKVQTEISILQQRCEHLKIDLAEDEKIEGSQLKIEHQQLVAENTSLQKWYDRMKKDLERVRANQTKA